MHLRRFAGSGKDRHGDASKTLTPVVLELGGKDPFVVCDDCSSADLDRISQIALRGVFQSMGQNCAGPERFFVGSQVYEGFLSRIKPLADQLVVGASNDDAKVDCGAVTMGSLSRDRLQGLVDDAVGKGARILSQGKIPPQELEGTSFFPPTVLVRADVNPMTAPMAHQPQLRSQYHEDGVGRPTFDLPTTARHHVRLRAHLDRMTTPSRRPTPVRLACPPCAFAASTARAKAVGVAAQGGDVVGERFGGHDVFVPIAAVRRRRRVGI